MALMDYGVIATKNNEIITTDLFTPMVDTLGISIEKDTDGNYIDEEYFVFLGEPEFYIAIYKTTINIYKYNEKLYKLDSSTSTVISHDCKYIIINKLDGLNKYHLKFTLNNDTYEAIYGYGVNQDINSWCDLTPELKELTEGFIYYQG